jgi:hypothetical protein
VYIQYRSKHIYVRAKVKSIRMAGENDQASGGRDTNQRPSRYLDRPLLGSHFLIRFDRLPELSEYCAQVSTDTFTLENSMIFFVYVSQVSRFFDVL